MKLTALLLGCLAVLTLASTSSSLHQKGSSSRSSSISNLFDSRERSIINDDDNENGDQDGNDDNDDNDGNNDDIADLIGQYKIDEFHPSNSIGFRQVDSGSNGTAAPIEAPTLRPAASDDDAASAPPSAPPAPGRPAAAAGGAPTPRPAPFEAPAGVGPAPSPPTPGGAESAGIGETLSPTFGGGDDVWSYDDEADAADAPKREALTERQYARCKLDLVASDGDSDSLLSHEEYLNFLRLNSASNGYPQFSSDGDLRLADLPYEYATAFHTQACLCSWLGEGNDCCVGGNEAVHIYFGETGNDAAADGGEAQANQTIVGGENTTSIDAGQTDGTSVGGGNTTTIDVGGGETDDYDQGIPVGADNETGAGGSEATGGGNATAVDAGGGETDDYNQGMPIDAPSATPVDRENEYRKDLPPRIQAAYGTLGYDETSWDDAYPLPVEDVSWDELSEGMKQAAIFIGYTEETWDGTQGRRRRRMQLIGMQALLDPEAYTRNFCTEVYYAYNVTKAPTYAPTTYAPTVTKITMTPSVAPSEKITPAPAITVPVTPSSAPIAGGSTMPPVGGGIVPTPPPNVLPTTTIPPVTASTMPPVGGGSVPTPPPNALSTPVVSSTLSPTYGSVATTPPAPTSTSSPVSVATTPPATKPVTSSPVSASPVSLLTSSPTFGGTSAVEPPPTTPPPVPASTSSPTPTATTIPATEATTAATAPTSASGDDVYPVYLQYGISSNCGVTGFDVLNANNNTIAEGLLTATQVLVVDILNTTFPRGGETRTAGAGHKLFHAAHSSYASMHAGTYLNRGSTSDKLELTDVFVDNELKMAQKQSTDFDANTEVTAGAGTEASTTGPTVYLEMRSSTDVGENVSGVKGGNVEKLRGQKNKKRKKKKKRTQARERTSKSNNNDRNLASLPRVSDYDAPLTLTATTYHRSLVYFTPDYPINITDVEDVFDQSCPAGINCMRVFSTVKVVLEEGDDAEEIATAITQGIAAAFTDGTFFQAIPPETIFCPGETAPPFTSGTNPPAPASTSPVSSPTTDNGSATGSPTPFEALTTTLPSGSAGTATSIVPTKAATAKPSAGSPSTATTVPSPGSAVTTTSKPTTGTTNIPPWALPDDTKSPTSGGGDASGMPTFSPTATPTLTTETGAGTSSPASSSSSTSPSSGALAAGNLPVEITYDIANDCGLDSEAIMNEVNNTLKTGLIAALTDTAIEILNQTFPRTERSQVRTMRKLHSKHDADRGLVRLGSPPQMSQPSGHRNLVYYTDDFPVTIDRIIDNNENCAEGSNCLLIISTITTVLEEGDDADAVNKALVDGVSESFNTGSFYEKIPADTVICPEDTRKRHHLDKEIFVL